MVRDSATPVEHRRMAPRSRSGVMLQGSPRGLGLGPTMATTSMNLSVAGQQGTGANMDVDVGRVRDGSAKLVPLSSVKQSSSGLDASHLLGKAPE